MAHSAIVIPVTVMEPVVRPAMARRLPQFMFADPSETHAHVTLLGPFVDRSGIDGTLVRWLAGFFAGVPPLSFTLRDPHTFPDGALVLRVEPSGPVCALTKALFQAYPDYPPYGGAHPDLVPHLTVDYLPDAAAGSAAALAALLPVSCTADEATLNWYAPGGSEVVAHFALSG